MATYDKNEIIYATDRNFNELRKKILQVYNARLLGSGDSALSSFSGYANVNVDDLPEIQNSSVNFEHALRTINAMVGAMIDYINNADKIPQVKKEQNDIIPSLTDLWDVVNDWGNCDETNNGCNAACSGFCTGAAQSKGPRGNLPPGNHGDQSANYSIYDYLGCTNSCDSSCGGSLRAVEGNPDVPGTCSNASCNSSCYDSCGTCTGYCSGGCTGGCSENCNNSCTTTCESDCSSYCGNNCSRGCSNACTGCTSACSSACGSYCSETCQYGCYGTESTSSSSQQGCTGCSGTCSNSCSGRCSGSCSVYCANSCTATCAECTGTCNNTCINGCGDSCSTVCTGTSGGSGTGGGGGTNYDDTQ